MTWEHEQKNPKYSNMKKTIQIRTVKKYQASRRGEEDKNIWHTVEKHGKKITHKNGEIKIRLRNIENISCRNMENQTCSVSSAPTVRSSVCMQRFRLFFGQLGKVNFKK